MAISCNFSLLVLRDLFPSAPLVLAPRVIFWESSRPEECLSGRSALLFNPIAESASTSKLWKQVVDDIYERARVRNVHKVETILF